jgi:hypothetical protein
MSDPINMRDLLDRAAILDLIYAYAQGADNPDQGLFLSVFAPDIHLELDGVGVIEGIANLELAMRDGTFSKVTKCELKASTHAMVNSLIKLEGDEASAVVHAISFLTGSRDGAPYSATRGLHYADKYRRNGGKWLMTYRKHSLRWLIEGACTPLPAI